MSFFDAEYGGVPPWDIGRPQPEIAALAQAGEVRGKVLDAGCGTGENALFLAGLGFDVEGLDFAPTAIAKARDKAAERGLQASFRVFDALRLSELDAKFDTVIDSGLFHSFSDSERPLFIRALASVLNPGAVYFMLCFSDRQPGAWGPRRIKQEEIRAAFANSWTINYIRPARFETNLPEGQALAWLASISLGVKSPPTRPGAAR